MIHQTYLLINYIIIIIITTEIYAVVDLVYNMETKNNNGHNNEDKITNKSSKFSIAFFSQITRWIYANSDTNKPGKISVFQY